MLTQFLTPGTITVYVDGPPGQLIVDQKLRKDPNGNVLMRKQFWKFAMEDWKYTQLVPPVLIYADLIGTGDARCIETAGRIRDGYLARLLED